MQEEEERMHSESYEHSFFCRVAAPVLSVGWLAQSLAHGPAQGLAHGPAHGPGPRPWSGPGPGQGPKIFLDSFAGHERASNV